jgi:hypothetical protein
MIKIVMVHVTSKIILLLSLNAYIDVLLFHEGRAGVKLGDA